MKITCPDCRTSYEIQAKALGDSGRSVKCAKCGNRWFATPDEADNLLVDAAGQDADDTTDASEAVSEKDEADWAADAAEDSEFAEAEPSDEAFDESQTPADDDGDEADFAADLEEDAFGDDEESPPEDIESRAKRPKIIVNPNKHRRNHLGQLFDWLVRRNFRRIGGVALFAVAVATCASIILARDGLVKRSPDLASLFQMIGFDVNLRGLEFRNLRIFNEVEGGKRVLVVEGSIRNLLPEKNSVPAVRLSIRDADAQEVYAWTIEPTTRSLNGLDETRFRTILADPPEDATDIQVRFVDRGKRRVVLE